MKIEGLKKVSFYLFIYISILSILAIQGFSHHDGNVLLCFFMMFVILIPHFISKKFHLRLPFCLEMIIVLFLFSSQILGEVCGFYERFPSWDNFLHFVNGFVMSSIGISFVFLVYGKKAPITFLLLCFAFCFSMTVAVFWEFGEFFLDTYFHRDCQKDTLVQEMSSVHLNSSYKPVTIHDISETHIYSKNGKRVTIVYGGYLDLGIHDTMRDLFVNFIGCLFYLCFSFFDITRGSHFFQKYFLVCKKN